MVAATQPTTDPAVTRGPVYVLDYAMPGGHLSWTVTRRLAGANSPLKLIVTLSDGLSFDGSYTPVLTAFTNDQASYSTSLAPPSLDWDTNGGPVLTFDLSGLPLAAADSVSVTFHSVIAATYSDGTPVGQGDVLLDSAVLDGQSTPPDTESVTLPVGTLSASIYAVNGVQESADAHAGIGALVTYRLHLHLPLSSAHAVQIVATPPGGAQSITFDTSPAGALPADGHAQWGPSATDTASVPAVSVANTGAITFDFGNLAPASAPGMSDIDLLFTTTLQGIDPASTQTLQAAETETSAEGVTSTSTATAHLAVDQPQLTVQTASLWASGPASTFTGSAGPWGFDPFTSQFGGTVNSASIDYKPYNDQVSNVQAGDEVVFAIVVQNRGGGPAYGLSLADVMPAGFTVPPEGIGLTVTDGAGNPLDFTGDPFDGTDGLTLSHPLAAWDSTSGANVVLATFTLQASTSVAVPSAVLSGTAQIENYAAAPGGPNLAGSASPATLSATTVVNTPAITISSVPDQSGAALPSGQQASFDVTVTIPDGTTTDLRIDEVLPHNGDAWLKLDSVAVLHADPNIQAPGEGAIGADGSLALGTVTVLPSTAPGSSGTLVLRVTAENGGSAAGQATLQTVVSASDPNNPGARWSSTASNTVALAQPVTPPLLSGISARQDVTDSMKMHPFAGLSVSDLDPNRALTLTIHLSDVLLGALSYSQGSFSSRSGTYVVNGTAAFVQQAARDLAFVTGPGRSGTEQFAVTVDDGAGGTATDPGAAVTVTAPSDQAAGIQHFPLSSDATVVVSDPAATGSVVEAETYGGPVSSLQSQFIFDGTGPATLTASTPSMFVKSVPGSSTVQLNSGQNVVDPGPGSNLELAGSGQDVFFLDARQGQVAWDSIVGFKPGDTATLWGFKAGVSSYSWTDSASNRGYAGPTLLADIAGDGQTIERFTFANMTTADTAAFVLSTGTVQGNDYLAITAPAAPA